MGEETTCPDCEGTGAQRGPVAGRLSSYKACQTCGGKGFLDPVVIEASPATISGKAQ